MLARIKQCLDEYQTKYRRPGLPDLELRGMYALFPEEGLFDFVESRWNDEYPNADRKGVYLIFGRSGTPLYVGKASMGASIGGRLGTYFAGNKECRLLSTDWTERPTYVATVAVPQGMSFEASALEEYFIKCLKPCDNKLGASEEVAAGDVAGHEKPLPGSDSAKPGSSGDVYTYSAPGMPMCPICGERPAIFYCSTHQSALCLGCVATHDVPQQCAYVPAFRAPKPVERQPPKSGPTEVRGTGKPTSILGI